MFTREVNGIRNQTIPVGVHYPTPTVYYPQVQYNPSFDTGAMLQQQNKLVAQIAAQNQSIHKKLEKVQNLMLEIQRQRAQTLQSPRCGPRREIRSAFTNQGSHEFSLDLMEPIQNPVCKGKYFNFKVSLRSQTGIQFPVEERIQLGVSVYSAENPPKQIVTNMAGGNILSENSTSTMYYDQKTGKHVANFKIQVHEVTSHFRNGWIFLVVEQIANSEFLEEHGLSLKPLIIKNLIIKAKETTCRRWRTKEAMGYASKFELCKKEEILDIKNLQ